MKRLITLIFTVLFLSGGSEAYAQFGMGGFNEYNTGVGMDRSIGGSQRNSPRKPEKVDIVKLTVSDMTKTLSLDAFQSAILKNIIEEYQANLNLLVAEDIPNVAKFEKAEKEKEKMEASVREILNEKQVILMDEIINKGKKKKSKKKDKNDEKDIEPDSL